MEGCFELVGYPEWWTPNGTKPQNNKAKLSPCAATTTADQKHMPNVTKENYNKLLKLLHATQVNENACATANMTGKISNIVGPQIIDSGASDHITHHENWLKM